MDEFFEQTEPKKPTRSKQVGHLYRKLFLLVFSIALIGQALLFVDKGLADYYRTLAESFKVILTVDSQENTETLEQWGQTLNQKEDITSVRLLSPEDALTVVRHKNPQLVDSLLLMGKNQMPAYFEITLSVPAVNNIRPFVDNLNAEYEELTPHYNEQHARMLFYVGFAAKLVRVLGGLALLGFVAFMFLVEAFPYAQGHAFGGLFSGVCAGVLSGVLIGALIYPTGLLADIFVYFTTWHRQVLLLVFCGLLGWTFSKWQKF